MRDEIREHLLELNRSFYGTSAESFAESRTAPQPGFYRILEELPRPCPSLLDVGCGEGRLGRFLLAHNAIDSYTGVDFSDELLAIAAEVTKGEFYRREISRPGALDDLGQFDVVASLAVLQHIPGIDSRIRLLSSLKEKIHPGGMIILSTWQFMSSLRQRRKIRDWSMVGLTVDDVGPDDYLLSWQRGDFALRYVCNIDEQAMARLADAAGLNIVEQFRSDGKEGNLSLYTLLKRQ